MTRCCTSGENNPFLYISIASFCTLMVSGALSYVNFPKISYTKIFWNIILNEAGIVTIDVIREILYIIFSIPLFFVVISFILIIIFRNDSDLREGIFGKFSKFHFIPILCATSLYIIGETYNQDNISKDISYIFSLIFSAIGLGSLIFIYVKTNMSKFITRFIIKKGLYSCLIVLFVYNLCYTITVFGAKKISKTDISKAFDWVKGCFIAFSLIIGIINLVLSFFLKDVVISGMNLIIYIGMTIHFFRISKTQRDRINGVAEGVIDIVIGALTLAMICFLIIKYKKNIF